MSVIGAPTVSSLVVQARSSLKPCHKLFAGRPGSAHQQFRFNTKAMASQDELKKQAGWKAVEYVESGMKLGLGTGSTAAFAVERIGQLLKEGQLKDIVGVPTSIRTYEQAQGAPASRLSALICGRMLPMQVKSMPDDGVVCVDEHF